MDGRVIWYALAFAILAGMLLLRAPLAEWVKPDNYPRDPYGWLTNQASHLALGVLIVTLAAVVGRILLGEYPYRLEIAAMAVALVLTFEIGVQGWQGADTAHDAAFMLYGAGGALLAFREVEAGGADVEGNPAVALAVILLAAVHLAAGWVLRR